MGLISSFSSGSSSTTSAISNVNSMLQAAAGAGSAIPKTPLPGASSFPTTSTLPSWLTTNPDDLQKELTSTYATAPKSILDAADAEGKIADEGANQAYGQAMRQGANATTQMANVSRQQGGTAKTSSIVAGQMAEDAGKQRTDARVQIAQMKLGATSQAASLSSQIASSLAGLRSSYLGTLAGVNSTLRGQDMNLAESNASNATTQRGQDISLAQSAASMMNQQSQSNSQKDTGGVTSTMSYTGQRGAGMGTYLGPMDSGGAGQHLLPGMGWG